MVTAVVVFFVVSYAVGWFVAPMHDKQMGWGVSGGTLFTWIISPILVWLFLLFLAICWLSETGAMTRFARVFFNQR